MFNDSTVTGSPPRVFPYHNSRTGPPLGHSDQMKGLILAIISEADTMSNLVSLKGLLFDPPTPETIFRKALSEASVTLDHFGYPLDPNQ
ncbi:MAG: hypothetical protein CM1200mP35_09710 [Chloroflexota bacterium]|nr:MAG: hypothetical protein CM1200mP35_09710 [Chloroflexota bacterium]